MKVTKSNLSRLTRWESFQFMENALSHIDNHTEDMSELFTAQLEKLKTAFRAFDNALVQEAKSTPEGLIEAEEERDYAIRKIYSLLREYSDYRFDPNKEKAANALLNVFKPYGTGSVIAAMAQEVETANITNLLQDIGQKEGMMTHIATLDLTSAINILHVNNNEFKHTQNMRLEDKAQYVLGLVKSTRIEAEKEFISFAGTVNALCIVEGSEKYTELKKKINALHDQFQARAKQRTKKKEDIVTEPSNN